MEIGVYFPKRDEYPALKALGIAYAVRPVLQPATGPNDAGFVSDNVIERIDNPARQETYLADEVLDPTPDGRARLAALKPGYFAPFSNGGYGFNVGRLAAFHPGLENGGGDLLIAPIRMLISALVCRIKRPDFTVIMYAVPNVASVRRWLWFYRLIGVRRVFIWRWDQHQSEIREALA